MKQTKDGNMYCITFDDFINLQESPAVFVSEKVDDSELFNEMVKEFAAIGERIAPQLKMMADLKKSIESHMKKTGEEFDCDAVKITRRKGYIRTSWNSQALIGYAVAHPEINEFKKTSVVKESLTIKVQNK